MNEPQPFDAAGRPGALVPRGPTWAPHAAPAKPPAQAGNVITVHFLWCSLVRWWKLALPVGLLLGGTTGTVLWQTLKPMYRAQAWLRIEDRRPYIAFPSEANSQVFARTQIELIRSPIVLGEILSDRDIAQFQEIKSQEAPLEWLKSNLSVSALNGSEFYEIKFDGPNPANAAKIVDAVIKSYLDFQRIQAGEKNKDIIGRLTEEQEKHKSKVEQLQDKVRQITKKATGQDPGIISPSKVYLAQDSPVQTLQGKLATIEVERTVLEAKIASLQGAQAKNSIQVPAAVLEQAVAADPEVQRLEQQLVGARAFVEDYKKISVLKNDPTVKEAESKITEMEQSLKDLKEKVKERHTDELKNKLAAERDQEVARLQTQVHDQNVLKDLYQKQLAVARKGLETLGGQALDLELARGEMALAEEVRHRIESRVTALRTEENAPTQVTRYGGVQIPVQPYTTPQKKVAAASLAGFALPFALGVLWELRVRRISNVEQITSEISLPVVGEITTLPVRSMLPGKRSADRFERHRSTFEESIAYLRTSLLLSDDMRDLQVLAVASAISREGKSSLASQLAVSLANATGETTLLIDSDMRDPDLHEMFGLPLAPGLAEVLEHQATLDDAIVTSWSRSVHVLTAGRLTRSPHVLLGSGTFHALLDEVRARYRYIVIDSPPVLAASEALVVAKAADGTLLCTMRDISRVGQVRQATERLRTAGARPLGAVFSGVPPTNYAYKYGGYDNSPYARRPWKSNAAAAGAAEAMDDEAPA
jgi:polysaccharide biosynthesis transport protein